MSASQIPSETAPLPIVLRNVRNWRKTHRVTPTDADKARRLQAADQWQIRHGRLLNVGQVIAAAGGIRAAR